MTAEHDPALVEKAAEALHPYTCASDIDHCRNLARAVLDAVAPAIREAALTKVADWAAGNALPGVSVEYLRHRAAQLREEDTDGR